MRNFISACCLLACLLGFLPDINGQGITTAEIAGTVEDVDNQNLPGAVINAVHKPTGTKYNVVTRANGSYRILNARVGGPYSISAEMTGFKTQTQNNVFLKLGETHIVNFKLSLETIELETAEVKGARFIQPINNTAISKEQINTLPNIQRSITEYTRLSPYANGQGFAGQSARFNAVNIDGSPFNNAFGLGGNNEPLMGTASGAQPISLDALEQLNIAISPYDVQYGGFTGASINAVTRSGTNDIEISAYSFFRNQSLTGTKVGDTEIAQTDFQNLIYGARVGGPIVKDKVFFFLSFERESREEPSNFLASRTGLTGDNVTRVLASDLDDLSSFLEDETGYKTGGYENYNFESNNDKILARLDFNLGNSQLNVRYNYVTADRDRPITNTRQVGNGNRFGFPTALSYQNSNWKREATINSISAELNSQIGSRINNRFTVGYTSFLETRAINGELFPLIDILQQGQTYISVGSDPFANNHRSDSKIFQVQNNISFQGNNHILTAGISYEALQFEYTVTPGYASSYIFNSLEDLYNSFPIGTLTPVGLSNGIGRPSTFQINYATNESGALPVAKPSFNQLGLYVQDDIFVSNNFKVSLGLRADFGSFTEEAVANEDVAALTFQNPQGENYTINTKELPGNQLLLSPRASFKWDLSNGMSLRAGSGLFTGRIPFIILSSQFIDNGRTQALIRARNNQANQYPFNQNPVAYVPEERPTSNTYDIVVNDPDLKMPQVWRSTVGLDIPLVSDLSASIEVMYAKEYNSIYAWNANLDNNTTTRAADGRVLFTENRLNNPPVLNAYVLDNIDEGGQLFTTFQVQKPMKDNWSFSLSYTYGQSENVSSFPGTGPIQGFRANPVSGNPNTPGLAFSDADLRHRVLGSLSYRLEYGGFGATTFGLFLQSQQAGRFSYTYSGNGDVNQDGVPANDLIFVPENISQIALEQYNLNGETITTDAQWAALESFINKSEYLKDRKGDFAERNGSLLPWVTQIDLRVLQDISFAIGSKKNTLQLSMDIINFGNLLSSSSGVYQLPVTLQPIEARNNGSFRVNPNALGEEFLDDTSLISRWQIQFGVRYTFQ